MTCSNGRQQLGLMQSTSPLIIFQRWLINTQIGVGFIFSPSLGGNKYSIGNNGCNP